MKNPLYFYILVYGFVMQSEKPLTAEQMSKLNFLEYILMLADLSENKNNFGVDDKGNLTIVDFHVILNLFLLTFFYFRYNRKNLIHF